MNKERGRAETEELEGGSFISADGGSAAGYKAGAEVYPHRCVDVAP
jgi:hypothetical protein